MEITQTQELVTRLKSVKAARGLSVSDILRLLEEGGTPLSETTLRRVFAEGSESVHFSYDATLRPLAAVLLGQDGLAADELADATARIQGLLDVIGIKNDMIASMTAQMESVKQTYERRIREYETRMAFLRDQIELKDRRMDEKDALILRLMNRVLPEEAAQP